MTRSASGRAGAADSVRAARDGTASSMGTAAGRVGAAGSDGSAGGDGRQLPVPGRTDGSERTANLYAGLDIGGSKVSAVAVDATGRVHGKVRLTTVPGPDGVVGTAVGALEKLARRLRTPVSALRGVGVGVPGLVDPLSGAVTHAVNLGLGAGSLALGDRLRSRLGLPVTVENDVNVAALGAAALLGRDTVDLAYLSVGTGLAAGLVLDGRLRRGSRTAAGEIGHIPVDPAGPACRCGQRGCLEAVASGSAIADRWPAGSADRAATALFTAARAGDAAAVSVRDEVANSIAAAVRLLVLTVDVELVVLGGGVAEVGPPLRAAVAAALARQALASEFLRHLDLPARLAMVPAGKPVAAVGAALLCLDTEPPDRTPSATPGGTASPAPVPVGGSAARAGALP